MIRFNRTPIPNELNGSWVKWTRYYLRRRNNGQGTFYWNKYPNAKGSPISKIIVRDLLLCCQFHCSYCDKFPLFKSDKTIDHFKPKSSFPLGAYQWTNLFPACDNCQTSKLNQFVSELLKPDEISYDFNRYFMIDYTTFKLRANPVSIRFDRKRANITIAIMNLNDSAHITSRRHQFERYKTSTGVVNLNDYPYRYMF